MSLQLILTERNIDNRIEFKSLPQIHQSQLLVSFKRYNGRKITLGKALAKNYSADLWQIVEKGKSTVLYEFWEINSESGSVFTYNSEKVAGVEMIRSRFVPHNGHDNCAHELCQRLQVAKRLNIDFSYYYIDNAGNVIDFSSPLYIPDSISKWRSLLKKIKVTESFIYSYSKYFDKKCWEALGRYSQLSPRIMRQYGKKLGWENLSSYQLLNEELIREFRDLLDWKMVSKKQKLSESFIREFVDKVSWEDIPNSQDLSNEFINEFKDKINFQTAHIKSRDLVYNFQDEKLNWYYIVSNIEIDEDFVRKFHLKFDTNSWSVISKKCKFSTQFINEFEGKIDWVSFSENQYLTDDQILKFKSKIDWNRFSVSGRQVNEDLLVQVQN